MKVISNNHDNDIGQVLLHLDLLSFQIIPLEIPESQSRNRNKRWGLTLVLSLARRPQSQPTNTAEYLIKRVDLSHGLLTTLASTMP